jgi:vacuolar protein sorting-associated protein 1
VRAQQAFRRYPALRERFNSVVVNFFKTAMTPTTKLVSDMVAMQACYVNTTHPDFLNGHKVRHTFVFLSIFSPPKAMALVTDRLNANKPATPEPKPGGKATAAQLNNNKDLEVDLKKEEPSFFGSFFSSAKSQQQKAKKGPQPMEPVLASSYAYGTWAECLYVNVATPGHSSADCVERARNTRD